MGGVRPNASENGQIGPRTIVRTARGDGSRPNLAFVLQEGRKYASNHGSPEVIWRIPVESLGIQSKIKSTHPFQTRMEHAAPLQQVGFGVGANVGLDVEADGVAVLASR
jgi:hypothetical protein